MSRLLDFKRKLSQCGGTMDNFYDTYQVTQEKRAEIHIDEADLALSFIRTYRFRDIVGYFARQTNAIPNQEYWRIIRREYDESN